MHAWRRDGDPRLTRFTADPTRDTPPPASPAAFAFPAADLPWTEVDRRHRVASLPLSRGTVRVEPAARGRWTCTEERVDAVGRVASTRVTPHRGEVAATLAAEAMYRAEFGFPERPARRPRRPFLIAVLDFLGN